jgi:hypothetical protein
MNVSTSSCNDVFKLCEGKEQVQSQQFVSVCLGERLVVTFVCMRAREGDVVVMVVVAVVLLAINRSIVAVDINRKQILQLSRRMGGR